MIRPIKIVECPRDAMQGWHHHIETNTKINYLNQLLQVGFDTLDCGSFVSPKAIPQMADTAAVLSAINMDNTVSKLLVIVANEKGAEQAVTFEQVTYLGFPFSISPTFQQLNTNSTIEQSLQRVEAIQSLCVNNNKQLVVYISMGFGNPYSDAYNPELVITWVDKLKSLGVKIISLADTVGVANPNTIEYLFKELIPAHTDIEIGAHFHTAPTTWQEKIEAAAKYGCTRFDGAINGIGGCPMAQDELIGNMNTLNLLQYFNTNNIINYNLPAFDKAILMANTIFV
jgi:hydroxymethylglutaryl-CoA lyase